MSQTRSTRRALSPELAKLRLPVDRSPAPSDTLHPHRTPDARINPKVPRLEPTKNPERVTVARSTSMRSRGLNLKTVSPAQVHKRSVLSSSQHLALLSQVAEDTQANTLPRPEPLLIGDAPIPLMDQLASLDIDEQLRLLAFKEMSVVEIKDNISLLTQSLERHEKEIHKVREVIQRSLYRELNLGGSTSENPHDEAVASTKNRSRRRTLSASNPNPIQPPPPAVVAPQSNSSTNYDKRNLKLWSSISKPLNLLQQFDTMLQSEFERSLDSRPNSTSRGSHDESRPEIGSVDDRTVKRPERIARNSSDRSAEAFVVRDAEGSHDELHKRRSEDSVSSYGLLSLPLKLKSRNAKNIDYDKLGIGKDELKVREAELRSKYLQLKERQSDDVLQLVSLLIWSFVNDVTLNVLLSLSEEGQEVTAPKPVYNLDNGSAVSLHEATGSDRLELKFDEFDDPNNSDVEDKIDLSIYRSSRKNE